MLPSCVNASLNDRLDICIYLRSPPEKLLPINFNYRPLDQPLIETFHVKYHFFNMLISHGEYFTLLYQNFHNLIHAYPFKTNASNIYSLYSPLLSFFFPPHYSHMIKNHSNLGFIHRQSIHRITFPFPSQFPRRELSNQPTRTTV